MDAEQVEKQFIDSNLLLIASQFNVDATKALVEQAKLWDNPMMVTDQNVYTNNGITIRDTSYHQFASIIPNASTLLTSTEYPYITDMRYNISGIECFIITPAYSSFNSSSFGLHFGSLNRLCIDFIKSFFEFWLSVDFSDFHLIFFLSFFSSQ